MDFFQYTLKGGNVIATGLTFSLFNKHNLHNIIISLLILLVNKLIFYHKLIFLLKQLWGKWHDKLIRKCILYFFFTFKVKCFNIN